MKKKVVFWGCGNIAVSMYKKYKDDISIRYVISNNSRETEFAPEEGKSYPVERPKKKEMGREDFILICSTQYEQIAEQLSLLGYTPFVDFMDYELAEILWSGKKIALLYGFCHLRGLADCLRRSRHFCESYVPVYYANYLFHNFYQQARLQYLADHCSLLVYGMALSAEYQQKNGAILERISSKVQTFCLQAAFFGAYFPQKRRSYNHMNVLAVKSEGFDYTPFSYGDSWLNDCILRGMRLDDIFEVMERGEVYPRDFILRYAQGEWRRLRLQERESDFRIADYIEKRYQTVRLFRNETHMENEILCRYAEQLLQALGISGEIEFPDVPLLNCSQHFIYPCVAKTLGLSWDVWEETLDLYTYAGWKKMSMREYVKKYFETCREVGRLKWNGFLPGGEGLEAN